MKQLLKLLLRQILNKFMSLAFKSRYLELLKINNIPNKPAEGEAEWIEKWSTLGKPYTVYYRLFSHYIGQNINIIPEDICRNIVEPIMDPLRYTAYYADKNIFDKLFRQGTLPKTIFRKIRGVY